MREKFTSLVNLGMKTLCGPKFDFINIVLYFVKLKWSEEYPISFARTDKLLKS